MMRKIANAGLISLLLVAFAVAQSYPKWPGTLVGIVDYNGNQFSSANPMPISLQSQAITIIPLDVTSVTTGGTPVNALSVGHVLRGGFILTTNAAGICVSQQGAAGTSTNSSTQCIAANQIYNIVPNTGAVSVNSVGSSVALSGQGYN